MVGKVGKGYTGTVDFHTNAEHLQSVASRSFDSVLWRFVANIWVFGKVCGAQKTINTTSRMGGDMHTEEVVYKSTRSQT